MFNKFSSTTLVLTLLAAAPAFAAQDIEAEMLQGCTKLAKDVGSKAKPAFTIDKLEAFATWHAACAEKPPTGKGSVTNLCQGTAHKKDGSQQQLFFWSKNNAGKIETGYFWCE